MNMTTRFFLGCLCFLFTSIAPFSAAWAAPESIMVFPLAIHAESSMDYIQTGVADLMETKLTESHITISRTPSALPRKDAVSQAKAGNMDALIMGSLTFLGESISINIKLISSETGENLMVFSKVESNKSNLFNDIEEFITQVADRGAPPAPARPVVTPEPAAKPMEQAATPEGTHFLPQGLVRSDDIKTEGVALCVGDVNGDGKKNIVLADAHTLIILNFQNGAFTESARIEGPSHLNILNLDAWDINGNGTDELMVTAVHARTGNVSSSAYGWDGTQYAQLCKNVDWFFKKASCPFSMEPALLGQQQQFSDGTLTGDMWTMVWDSEKSTLASVDPCANPLVRTNLYSFATGDLFHTGETLTITYMAGDYLSVLKSSKEELWSSSERFGGSNRFLNKKQQSPPQRYYLTPRIETGDFNRDGKTEVVTIHNKNATPRMFTNLKKFVEGQVVCLSWNALDFTPLWTTSKIPGYIADFTISDVDGNGGYDLVYCVIPKKSSFFSKKKSYVVVQPIAGPTS